MKAKKTGRRAMAELLKKIRDGKGHRASQETYERVVAAGLATYSTEQGWQLTDLGRVNVPRRGDK